MDFVRSSISFLDSCLARLYISVVVSSANSASVEVNSLFSSLIRAVMSWNLLSSFFLSALAFLNLSCTSLADVPMGRLSLSSACCCSAAICSSTLPNSSLS